MTGREFQILTRLLGSYMVTQLNENLQSKDKTLHNLCYFTRNFLRET